MDALDQLTGLLDRRNSLEESMRYASPEEARVIHRTMRIIMWQVIVLMGRIDWIDKTRE
jgi:hypothetical protein